MSAEKVRQIFVELLANVPPERWDERLAECAGADEGLRQRVKLLLRAHQDDSFLASPAAGLGETIDYPITERPGAVIGPYKLMEQIGEGGMGLVFVAEQQQPVRRKVALKVIKPGMDTRQVVARFEAERQALALMDHPNIAKILDGGSTGGEPGGVSPGRPYFVMELVKGVPITEYCDQNQVPVRERLTLFLDVCQAVQHAHQKGIIHRDIKPSNVLVMSHDGRPVVKVIDFGVAKAVGQRLTDKTIYTQFSQLVGTPLYMSPEQAGQSGLDVDTRSDIYSLGVLLYELLTGTTPFDKERLRAVDFDEIRRIIREEEPPKPSTRISTLGQAATTVGTNRKSDPRQLSRLCRGELDWIVMKALDKDRNRRYESASAFAADVQRYLHDEPVQACPPSTLYKTHKFIRRHRTALAASALIIVTLVVALASLIVSYFRVSEEMARTEQAQHEAQHNLGEALQAADKMLTRVAEDRVAQSPHMEPLRRGLLEDALAFYQTFLSENSSDPTTQLQTAMAHRRLSDIQLLLGEYAKAKESANQAIELLKSLDVTGTEVRHELANTYASHGNVFSRLGPPQEAEQAHEAALKLREQLARENPKNPAYQFEVAKSCNVLALVYRYTGRVKEAEDRHREAIAYGEKLAAAYPDEPRYRCQLIYYYANLGQLLLQTKELQQVETLRHKALALAEQVAKELPKERDHDLTLASAHGQLAVFFQKTGQLEKSAEQYRLAVKILSKLANDFPSRPDYKRALARVHNNFGAALFRMDQMEEAQHHWRRNRDINEKLVTDYPLIADYHSEFALALNNYALLWEYAPAKLPQGCQLLREAIRRQEKALAINPKNPEYRQPLAMHYHNLARLLGRLQEPEAEQMAKKAIELNKRLVEEFPFRPENRSHLAGNLTTLAIMRVDQGDLEEARRLLEESLRYEYEAHRTCPLVEEYRRGLYRHYLHLNGLLFRMQPSPNVEEGFRQAIADLEVVVAGHPAAADLRHILGALLQNLASLLYARQERQAARQLLEKAIVHQQAALQVSPDDIGYLTFLRNHYWALAEILKRLGDPGEAEAAYRRNIPVLEKLIRLAPKNPAFESDLGAKLNDLAALLLVNQRDLNEIRQLLERAIIHQQAALKQQPAAAAYRRFLGQHYRILGSTLLKQERVGEAEDAYRRCLAVREQLAQEHPQNGAYQADVAEVKGVLARLKEAKQKEKDR